ncbi:MAG TPA: ABC transporter permease [Humisphaera sp.]|jgi:lipopolysaccharide transport system permease protein|nr:ABC transporter permease [Humisphaera sp.]
MNIAEFQSIVIPADAGNDRREATRDGSHAKPRQFKDIERRSRWSMIDPREIWQYRDLLFVLAMRDVKLRYRQALLGVCWVVLQPLLSAGVFAFVFGHVLKTPSDGVPYMVFCFAGMLVFNAFSGTLSRSSACIVGNSQLISKIYFPRLVLPLSTVFATLIDFAVGLALMFVILALGRIGLGWRVLLLPAWIVLAIGLAVGLGLYTCAAMVRYRDLQYVIPVLLQLILYASPIAYPMSAAPAHLRTWLYLNPLSSLLEACRWSLLGRGAISGPWILYSVTCVIVSLLIGATAFKRLERDFADVI